jgi:hypothetical protein
MGKKRMGSSASKTSIVNQANTIVADVFTDVTMTCASVNKGNQTISIECNPDNWGGEIYENNAICTNAIKNEYERRMDQYNTVMLEWKNGNLSPGEGLSIEFKPDSVRP